MKLYLTGEPCTQQRHCYFVEGIALFFKKQEECAALIRLYGRKRNPAETDRGKGWLR